MPDPFHQSQTAEKIGIFRGSQVYLLVSDAAREVLRLEHDIVLTADR